MLRVDQMTGRRGGRPLFTGVSFTLHPGQGLLIKGANGIGKTTLLESLAGHHRYVTGSVFFGQGEPLTPEKSLFLGTSFGFKDCLSVLENMLFWASVYESSEEACHQALSYFGLLSLADRGYTGLSTGQKQRLSLTRLLLTQRPLWLLDEPFLGLDEGGSFALKRLLEAHLDQGGLFCLTSHVPLFLSRDVVPLDLDSFRCEKRMTEEEEEILAHA